MKVQISRVISLLLTGLIAGTFFYGTFAVIPAFYEVPGEIHLSFRTALMRHNAVLVMALVILAIVGLAIYAWQVRKVRMAGICCLTALIFTIISLVITRLGSVPINLQMKTWNPGSPPDNWLQVLATWDFYNLIRTGTSIGSFICLLIADLFLAKYFKDKSDKANFD